MSGSGSDVPASEAVLVDRLRAVEKDVARLHAAGARLGRQLHERASRDRMALENALAASERRNATLERHLVAARRNARRAQSRAAAAEQRLKAAQASATWRVGRAVMAGPRTVRRRMASGDRAPRDSDVRSATHLSDVARRARHWWWSRKDHGVL